MAHGLLDLDRLPTSELERIVRTGETPEFGTLDGWVFMGANVTAPGSLLFRKFSKGFFTETRRDGRKRPMGYNVACYSSPLEEEWKVKPDAQNAKAFGFYSCKLVRTGEPDALYPGSLLLNYGEGQNGLDLSRFLRDYLVRVEPGNDDLFLGKAYLALGPALVPAGFFAIKRWAKAPAKPPRPAP